MDNPQGPPFAMVTCPTKKGIFRGYIATEEEARKLAPNAKIGGEYRLSNLW
jgi:hypothetical protein